MSIVKTICIRIFMFRDGFVALRCRRTSNGLNRYKAHDLTSQIFVWNYGMQK